MGLFDFSGFSATKIAQIAQLSDASYAGRSDPDGWRSLTAQEIGFQGSASSGFMVGTTYNTGLEGTSLISPITGLNDFSGEAKVFISDAGDEITISFRGTNNFLDYTQYGELLTDAYVKAYSDWLDTIAEFANSQGISADKINITGHSLGGGAVNQFRNIADEVSNGFYEDSNFVAFATPKVSNNPDIINIGFENDFVYKIIPRSNPFASEDYFSTLDNFFLWIQSI